MRTPVKIVTKLDWPSFRNVAEAIRRQLAPYCTCTVHDQKTAISRGRIIFMGTADRATLQSVKPLIPGSQVVFYATTEGLSRLDETGLRAAKDLTVVAVSNFARSMLEQAGLSVAGVVHHGIDMNDRIVDFQYYRKLRKKFGNRKIILTVSANHLRKGLDRLLNAYRIVDEQAANVFLILHSQPDGYYDLADQVERLRISTLWLTNKFGRVSQRKLNALYKLCTVYVQPSLSEGFGLPILEAFRFNKPAIAVRAPPFDEIITHKETGILVPLKKATWSRSESIDFKLNEYADGDLAEAILRTIQDRELILKLQRQISVKKSSWDAKGLYPDLLTYF